jgi:hypothetical protein
METTINISSLFPGIAFLGARASGEIIREMVEKELEKGNTIILDFNGIEDITQGFGDEVIGIFVRTYGKDYLKDHIKVINYSEDVKIVLNWVVSYSQRLHQEKKSSD